MFLIMLCTVEIKKDDCLLISYPNSNKLLLRKVNKAIKKQLEFADKNLSMLILFWKKFFGQRRVNLR